MSVPVKVLNDCGLELQTCTVPNSTWDGNSESLSNTDLHVCYAFVMAKQRDPKQNFRFLKYPCLRHCDWMADKCYYFLPTNCRA